eukprot:c18769_g1_i3.p1 GENE.c18769_g1_i3~~c18769_g1_i3.p1  ORF type:complete len:141 (+),score=27.48 c18769_g1_i3:54-476(+)
MYQAGAENQLLVLAVLMMFMFPVAVLKVLRSLGADPKVVLEISRAVEQGDVADLRAVLQASPNLVNTRMHQHRWTPLVLAAVNNHIEVVRLLIQLKANVNCADNNGWTPLYIAARCGHFAVVQELLDHGGNVNVFDEWPC